jgi:5-oxopent-3-ene-1,2,5-tricarboxylate decarboxylase / 2-hydroxyhepta-2,4-diene-1,7-dioate isomerase
MNPAVTGTVYGTLMNFRGEWAALGERMHAPPYKAPPQAPVLYIKTANTWTAHDAAIALPAQAAEVEIGATVGMVMGHGSAIAGYVLMNDLSLPHDSLFRPPVKFRCLDGFLGIGHRLVPHDEAGDPALFELQVRVNGVLRQTVRFADLVRPAQRLLDEVAGFMTLAPGDVLMLGCDTARPRARVGDRIEIAAPALGSLVNTLVQEGA